MPHWAKRKADLIDSRILNHRASRCMAAGYAKQKWIIFCETLIAEGFCLSLYEAKTTCSKYIFVSQGPLYKKTRCFKVRFSNHKPNFENERNKDCDFFVGVSNLGVTTTDQALVAVRNFFPQQEKE